MALRSYNRGIRIAQGLTAVAAAGLLVHGCHASEHTPEPNPQATTYVPDTAPASPALIRQEAATLATMKQGAISSARIILSGLARPEARAKAHYAPEDRTTVGTVSEPGNDGQPETYIAYDPSERIVYLESVSTISKDASGLSDLSLEEAFRLPARNALTAITNRALTVADYQQALSNPTDIQLVSAGATSGAIKGYGVAVDKNTLVFDIGRSADLGATPNSYQQIDIAPNSLNALSVTETQLVIANLNTALAKTATSLASQLDHPVANT